MNYNVENELVEQKDHILRLVNDDKFNEAIILLHFSQDLWKKCGYEYKTREIAERIVRRIDEMLWDAVHWKMKRRLNDLRDRIKGMVAA